VPSSEDTEGRTGVSMATDKPLSRPMLRISRGRSGRRGHGSVARRSPRPRSKNLAIESP
jgi:hypothetical protein